MEVTANEYGFKRTNISDSLCLVFCPAAVSTPVGWKADACVAGGTFSCFPSGH